MKRLMDDLLAEKVNYGGIAATRLQVYRDIERRFPDNPRYGFASADYQAFARKALDEDEIASLIRWGDVCLDCGTSAEGEELADREQSLCAKCAYAEPCLICGAPILNDEGHDEGCMLIAVAS